jgi:hypothetical protein
MSGFLYYIRHFPAFSDIGENFYKELPIKSDIFRLYRIFESFYHSLMTFYHPRKAKEAA